MPALISRATYADIYGPTTGDRIRLADTDLINEVERYGEEVKFGGGKVIRDGMDGFKTSRKTFQLRSGRGPLQPKR